MHMNGRKKHGVPVDTYLHTKNSVSLEFPVDDVVVVSNRGDHSHHQCDLGPHFVDLVKAAMVNTIFGFFFNIFLSQMTDMPTPKHRRQ